MGTGNRLVDVLSEPVRDRLRTYLQLTHLRPGRVLADAGDSMRHVYFPVGTLLALTAVTAEGDSLQVAAIGADGCSAETVTAGMTVSPHRVVVQLAGGAYRVPIDVVRYELLKNEAFRGAMIASVADLAAQCTQSALCVAFHPLVPRVARWLLQTRDYARSSTLEVTQDVVAQMLGVFRQRISPALMELEAQSLIHQGVGRIHIVNRPGLQALACECYETRLRAGRIAQGKAVSE